MTGQFKIKQVRRQVKQEKVDQWPPYAARRNLIQVNTRYTCTVLHKDFEPRRQLEPKGTGTLPFSSTVLTKFTVPARPMAGGSVQQLSVNREKPEQEQEKGLSLRVIEHFGRMVQNLP